MKKYYLSSNKCDIKKVNILAKIIKFHEINQVLKEQVTNELLFFLKKNTSCKHILIVGLGNDNYTADSIGPNVLKYIKVNYSFNNYSIKVSALEPGVLKETGIVTFQIIKSLVEEIKPDLIILIDAFISDNIDDLNKTIIISNSGLKSGIGIKELNEEISDKTLHTKVVTIGVPTAIELKLKKKKDNFLPYILSTKDIDDYVINISKLIGESINNAISKY